mgnify:CR=1 FL=1
MAHSGSTQFARAYIPWVLRWREMDLSKLQIEVMLLLISGMERDAGGGWFAYFSRESMAEMLGVSENTMKRAIQGLKAKGALVKKGFSRRGHCQEYWIMPVSKGNPYIRTAPKGGTERTQSEQLGGTEHVRKGVRDMSERGGRPVPPSIYLDGDVPPSYGRADAPQRKRFDYESKVI